MTTDYTYRATFSKLRTGEWGARVVVLDETADLPPDGTVIPLLRRRGGAVPKLLVERVWAGHTDDGEATALYAIADAPADAPPAPEPERVTREPGELRSYTARLLEEQRTRVDALERHVRTLIDANERLADLVRRAGERITALEAGPREPEAPTLAPDPDDCPGCDNPGHEPHTPGACWLDEETTEPDAPDADDVTPAAVELAAMADVGADMLRAMLDDAPSDDAPPMCAGCGATKPADCLSAKECTLVPYVAPKTQRGTFVDAPAKPKRSAKRASRKRRPAKAKAPASTVADAFEDLFG